MSAPTVPPQHSENLVAPPVMGLARQYRLLAVCTAVLIACFAKPLYELVRLAARSELFSYILLVPVVSVYLGKLKAETLKSEKLKARMEGRVFVSDFDSDRPAYQHLWGWGLVVAGFVGYGAAIWLGPKRASVDGLAWVMLSFFVCLVGACALCLKRETLKAMAFPIGFLVFLAPFPVAMTDWIEGFLQHSSAEAAALLFGLVGTPFLKSGTAFQLPGFSLEVAPECSGIHSTLVLFISSLVAGQLFLRSNWKRALFAVAVIPLGILRNGFRILVLGELCVHVDPAFIDSPLHHRGGPVFFLISLIPFFLLLYLLLKTDRDRTHQDNHAH